MGQNQGKTKKQMEEEVEQFIKQECISFPKLCTDIIKMLNVFSNEKYMMMIGFDLNIHLYFTPKQKGKK